MRLPDNPDQVFLREAYLRIWTRILRDVAGWPDERIKSVLRSFAGRLRKLSEAFRHEAPAFHLMNHLLADVGLTKEGNGKTYYVVRNQLLEAIEEGSNGFMDSDFDWIAAARRYQNVLTEHGLRQAQ